MPNQQVSEQKLQEWVSRFRFYRKPPTSEELRSWIDRFRPNHVDLAIKILDNVEIVSEVEIQEGYRESLNGLNGWSKVDEARVGRWFFVGLGTAGESGPAMVRLFREANKMSQAKWREFFVEFRELPKKALTAYDNVVFIDDFSGSGRQIVDGWPLVEELIASEAKLFLILTAITEQARDEILEKTEFNVVANKVLPRAANVVSDDNGVFSPQEKIDIEAFGRIAWPAHPCGYGRCALLFVLSHKTPNNTIPILHANTAAWEGPFPRHLLK